MINFDFLTISILYQILKIILSILKKKSGDKIENLSIRIYVNKMENRIIFQFKIGSYLQLLTPKTTKSLESTKSMITKNENDKNAPRLEITEVVLVILSTKVINKIQESCIHLFLINRFANY